MSTILTDKVHLAMVALVRVEAEGRAQPIGRADPHLAGALLPGPLSFTRVRRRGQAGGEKRR